MSALSLVILFVIATIVGYKVISGVCNRLGTALITLYPTIVAMTNRITRESGDTMPTTPR